MGFDAEYVRRISLVVSLQYNGMRVGGFVYNGEWEVSLRQKYLDGDEVDFRMVDCTYYVRGNGMDVSDNSSEKKTCVEWAERL